MFKKKPTIKTLSPLRSSDRRKTAERIISDFGINPQPPHAQEVQATDLDASENPAEAKAAATAAHSALRNSLLPENSLSAKFSTTHGPQLREVTGTVYVGSHGSGEQRVLWVSLNDRLYPSVYTLWKNPGIIPILHTPSIVVQKMKGGADLMTPGLAGPPFPSKAKAGAIVAVASLDSPTVPVAVGTCTIDVSALEKTQGAKGAAVETFHWAGDELWDWSTSGKSGLAPPESVDGWLNDSNESRLVEQTRNVTLEEVEAEGGVSLAEPPKSDRNGHISNENDLAEVVDPDNEPDMTTKEIDETFRRAFLYGVYHHKKMNSGQPKYGLEFPMNQSVLMSSLVQPFLPTFTQKQTDSLQMKKTSWKKALKFIKSLDKEKLLLVKDRPNNNEADVWDIDFDDPAFTRFEPYTLPKKEINEGRKGAHVPSNAGDTTDDSIGQKLKLMDLFKPKESLAPIFAASNSSTKSTYSKSELRQAVTSYTDTENLTSSTNRRLVNLNPVLSNVLFDPDTNRLDADVLSQGSIPRDALVDRVIKECTPYHVLLRNDEEFNPASGTSGKPAGGHKAKAGAAPKVGLVLETRSGNKTVTRVYGLESFFVRPAMLAEELRKVCASSTSVEALKGGKPGTLEVMVQGPQRDAVIKALEKRGLRKEWVDFVDKTKGKKKSP